MQDRDRDVDLVHNADNNIDQYSKLIISRCPCELLRFCLSSRKTGPQPEKITGLDHRRGTYKGPVKSSTSN